MEPTPVEDVAELTDIAVDWQKQFHELAEAIEAKGYKVEYGDHGQPIVIDSGKVSDGYHTFDELYEHRITLWIALCRKTSMTVREAWNPTWRTRVHSDGSSFDGWFVLGMFKSHGKQITYHLPNCRWDECSFAVRLDRAPDFDGHSSVDVLQRISDI